MAMDGMMLSKEPRQIDASGSRELDPRRRGILRATFEARYGRMKALLNEWGSQLPPADWRMRLIHKALYSTWADLRSLQEVKK